MAEWSSTFRVQAPDPHDPTQLYNIAVGFYLGGKRCLLVVETGPWANQALVTPAVVDLCFAAEMFMKALLTKPGQRAPRGHELLELFGQLDASDQAAVERIYQTMSAAPLSTVLPEISGYFVKVRYQHEYPVVAFNESQIAAFALSLWRDCAERLGLAHPPS